MITRRYVFYALILVGTSAALGDQSEAGSHFPGELQAIAREKGKPGRLPAALAPALLLSDTDLDVQRFAMEDVPNHTFRSIDLLPSSSDFLLFIRKGPKFVFWRVSREGNVQLTVEAISGGATQRVDNARYAKEFKEVCEYFYVLLPGEAGENNHQKR